MGKYMADKKHKEEILRFVLDSSDEENENLAVFIAGIQAQERAFQHQKTKEGSGTAYVASGAVPATGE
jgi:hypothetical protein